MKSFSKMLFVTILLLLFSTSTNAHFIYSLIKDYLLYIKVNVILFVTCAHEDPTDVMQILGIMQNNSLWISHWKILNESELLKFDYDRFFTRSSYPICVVTSLECKQTTNVFREISQRKMFHYERNWLIFGGSSEEIFNVLRNENINVDAEIAAVVPYSNEFRIEDIYNPSHTRQGRIKIDNIGSWNQKVGLRMEETKTKIERRHDLGGITFSSVLAIPTLPPNKTLMEHLNSDENSHLDSSTKNSYRVFQLLMEMFNFKMTIRRSKIWGALDSNGKWLGALGLINRSEVDICVSGVRWENDRYGAFEQTTDFFYVQILIVFRHPKIVEAMNIFVMPFDDIVWLLIVLIAIGFSIVMTIIFILENNLNRFIQNYKIDPTNTTSNSILMIFGILFQQGFSGQLLSISTRVLTTTVLLFSIVIYQFYSSFLVGSLLMEAPKTIKTVKHLLNSKLEVAIDDTPYVQDTFKYIREENTAQLYNKVMTTPSPIVPLFKGLNKVKRDSFAYVTDANYAYKLLKSSLTDSEVCDLQEVKVIQRLPTHPPLPNKSPLKEMVKIGIRKLYETGVLAHVWKVWLGHKPKCVRSDVDVVPVDITHFSSALYVLGCGIHISMAVFTCELVVKHFGTMFMISVRKLSSYGMRSSILEKTSV